LGDAIRATGIKNFIFENHIIFAEVNDHPDEVAVVPGILCRELKPNGKVKAKAVKGATPLPKSKDSKDVGDESDANIENKAPTTKQDVFYIQSRNRQGITKKPVSNTAYDGKLMCIIARDRDTLGDAISKDGRFSDGIMLLEDNDRQAEVPLHYKVSDFSRQTFIMKKRAAKRKKDSQCLVATQNENPSVVSSIPDNLDDPFTEVIGREMINNARQNALETFAKPGAKCDTDHYIKKMVQEFGKQSHAIPARITETLAVARKSVGYIHSGDYAGTCFLLTGSAIITCKHVINQIAALRSETTDPELYQKIFVNFDYDYPGQLGNLQAEIDEEGEAFFGLHDLDYVIRFLKPNPALSALQPLGPLVRTRLPQNRRVVLMGHPEGQCKLLEICQIIPDYKWHATLAERKPEADNNCQHECQLFGGQNVQCIHMHKGDILKDDHSNDVPYDTSFFHGSSGSPVFNADGHIVAMHRMGYPYFLRSTKFSLMEFGITFSAIYRDLEMRYGEDIANHFLPGVKTELLNK
jgi:hypothetical protein